MNVLNIVKRCAPHGGRAHAAIRAITSCIIRGRLADWICLRHDASRLDPR